MRNYGRAAVSEFLEDNIVYRNLVPVDPRLPPLDAIRETLGLPSGQVPRKTEPEYARVVASLLRQARTLDRPGGKIERLLFLGDTRLLDATAFDNLCQAGGWPGIAFIGSEDAAAARVETGPSPGGQTLCQSNRWAALENFHQFCRDQGFPVDESTAVVIDLDKTAIGARGRNAHVIDQARVEAVRQTVAVLLGRSFNPDAFQTAYDQLNRPEFHPFTADNQDYLAYTCLILGSGLYDLGEVVNAVRTGRLGSFQQFIQKVNSQADRLPPELAAIHELIYANVQAGDPTPFKEFRRKEYLTTITRMGFMEDTAPVASMLADEIVITGEVRQQALAWREQGALLFGLSDKPDEASLPTEEQAGQGYAPIHRTPTHVVGSV